MKRLINISNHPSHAWSTEQLKGWDEVIDIEFPRIRTDASVRDIEKEVQRVIDSIVPKIAGVSPRDEDTYVYVAGEYTFVSMLLLSLLNYVSKLRMAFPVTQRHPDKNTFVFYGWRTFEIEIDFYPSPEESDFIIKFK
ncbi:MAG: hypothetical protein QXI19_10905 [Candidatus Caldarchaeum sp.]